MTSETFPLVPGVSTRQVNKTVRDAIQKFCDTYDIGVEPDFELRRNKGERRYVFGVHTSLRSTLVAHYVVGSGELMLVFPNNYRGWCSATTYDRLRVAIRDEVVYKSGIVNR